MGADSKQGSKMDICNIRSVQRVVNFTPNNGKMLRAEQPQAVMPGVTMICDLPLLFMNGLPTCLENLSVNQLEKFVPYMMNCSGASMMSKPKWWPDEIDFSAIPLRESEMTDGKWLSNLKKIVLSCYSYHGCEYALRLCANTSHECHSEWTLVDGLDGTMYLYNKVTRQISTAFKSADIICSRRRRTFSNNPCRKSNANYGSTKRNKPPIQIYLCDTCDLEFRTLEEVQVHEKKCSMPAQELQAEMHKIRVPNTRKQMPRIKIQTASRISHLFCLPPYLKKRTARSKTLSSPDSSENQNMPLPSHKSRRNNYDSLKKIKNVISPLPRSTCEFLLNSNSHSFDTVNNELSTLNISAKCISHVKSPVTKKRMSLMPNKQNQGLLIQNSETDTYLCDKCDREFSFSDFRHHETHCKDRTKINPSPVVSVGEIDTTQECFLKYFHLSSSSLKPCPASQGRAWFGNPMRYSSIPIASPLGNLIHGRSRVPTAAISSKMEKVERYCPAKPNEVFQTMRTKQNTDDWRVSWKSLKTTTEHSLHRYLYPMKHWWKMPFLRKMQIKEEKKLRLLRTCKSIQISVRRMTDKEIQNYTSCRSVCVKLKKLSLEKYISRTNRNKTSPLLRELLSQSVECTAKNSMAPKIERLSFQEIKQFSKPTQTLSDVTNQITNADLIGPLSKVTKYNSSSKSTGNRNRSQESMNKPSIGKKTCC